MSVICKGGEGDACKSSVVILWFLVLDLSCSFYSHLRETDPSLAHNVSLASPGLHLVYEGRLTTNHVKNRHRGERGEVYPERGSLCIFLMSFHDSNKAQGQKSVFPTVSPCILSSRKSWQYKTAALLLWICSPNGMGSSRGQGDLNVPWNAFWAQLPFFQVESHMALPCKVLYSASHHGLPPCFIFFMPTSLACLHFLTHLSTC